MTRPDHKRIAEEFLRNAASGRVDEAYRHVDMGGVHHSAYFPAGFPALAQAMRDTHREAPNRAFEVLRCVAEGDLVMVHSKVERSAEPFVVSVVHVFRFAGGRIVELWDVGMPVPQPCVNDDGAF